MTDKIESPKAESTSPEEDINQYQNQLLQTKAMREQLIEQRALSEWALAQQAYNIRFRGMKDG